MHPSLFERSPASGGNVSAVRRVAQTLSDIWSRW